MVKMAKQDTQEQQQPDDNLFNFLLAQRIEERLQAFNELLEGDPFIKQKKAEWDAKRYAKEYARGYAMSFEKGKTKALRKAVVTIVEARFPALVPLAEQKVQQLNKPDILKLLLKQVLTVDDENTARWLLNTFAA